MNKNPILPNVNSQFSALQRTECLQSTSQLQDTGGNLTQSGACVQHQQLSQLVISSFAAAKLGYIFPLASEGCS